MSSTGERPHEPRSENDGPLSPRVGERGELRRFVGSMRASSDSGNSLPKSKHRARLGAGFERWNRKLHFYFGLFMMFFVWLFVFSGLLLNHPKWKFHEHWSNRKQRNYEREIAAPGPEAIGDL